MTTDKTQRERDLETARAHIACPCEERHCEHVLTHADELAAARGVEAVADKTQRERDEDEALERHRRGKLRGHRLKIFADGAEHGRRGSDAWRAAMRSASHLLRHAASAIKAKGAGDAEAAGASGALDSWATSLAALAGTEPPRTYADGLREAAELLERAGVAAVAKANGAADDDAANRARAEAGALAAVQVEVESLAVSTPPATPADGAGERPQCSCGSTACFAHDVACPLYVEPATPEQPRSAAPPADDDRQARLRLLGQMRELIAVIEDGNNSTCRLCRKVMLPGFGHDSECPLVRIVYGPGMEAARVVPPADDSEARRLLAELVEHGTPAVKGDGYRAALDAARAYLSRAPLSAVRSAAEPSEREQAFRDAAVMLRNGALTQMANDGNPHAANVLRTWADALDKLGGAAARAKGGESR